jgi:hypothetical protein
MQACLPAVCIKLVMICGSSRPCLSPVLIFKNSSMKKSFYLLTMLSCFYINARAQATGSVSTYGGALMTKSISSGGTSADISETLYIGPGTHQIDGTWEIYAHNVVIDPAAVLSGSGSVVYYSPAAAGGTDRVTLMDGNATVNAVDVNQQLNNAFGLQLTEITFPVSHTAAGWANNATASTLYSGRDLDLVVDGADITLGTGVTGDLRLDADASISNYRPERMVIVNNSILSHMVKEDFTSSFIFPVGIADGDYTPAQIRNTANGTVHVSVQDYVASASYEQTLDPGPAGVPSDGMNRTWHIYADAAGTGSIVNLQHNALTNQSGFTDATHFVTRWSATIPNPTGDYLIPFSASAWQSNTAGAGAAGSLSTTGSVAGYSMRDRGYAELATSSVAEESYFSKSSDPSHPLPLDFLQQEALGKDCAVEVKWKVNTANAIEDYTVRHSTDGRNYRILARIPHVPAKAEYSYTQADAAEGNNFYTIDMNCADGKIIRSATLKRSVACTAEPVISVYPNPAAEFVAIENLSTEATLLRLYSIDGKLVLQQAIAATKNGRYDLDIAALLQGHYLLQIVSATKEHHVILVKE